MNKIKIPTYEEFVTRKLKILYALEVKRIKKHNAKCEEEEETKELFAMCSGVPTISDYNKKGLYCDEYHIKKELNKIFLYKIKTSMSGEIKINGVNTKICLWENFKQYVTVATYEENGFADDYTFIKLDDVINALKKWMKNDSRKW